MTPAEAARQMQHIIDSAVTGDGDPLPDISHSKADSLMCQALRELGYGEMVDIFEKSERWYA